MITGHRVGPTPVRKAGLGFVAVEIGRIPQPVLAGKWQKPQGSGFSTLSLRLRLAPKRIKGPSLLLYNLSIQWHLGLS